ncbi:L-type lectin-domain containing receptor kinase IV.1-like [Iris pallida]|uniref:L-type lectin-domain containing receptor kinase IV.1-like n=1 Tax=Iris pallida TaxID=29817 RepID=A0AAX6GXC3_IRIPA|nr:L-type lectin-domain containing receptor kinase IV.1-like [Iris pallida]
MVAIDVSELQVLERVELDCQYAVARVPVVFLVEQADVLVGQHSRELGGGRDDECQAAAADFCELGHHREHEGGREGEYLASASGPELEWRWIEGVSHLLSYGVSH